jgi:Fe-S oxidoreductase
VDLARFALGHGLRLDGAAERLYHAPCHDSLQGKAAEVLAGLGGYQLRSIPHCCSEAGTLALSRPDISDAMLHKKATALEAALADSRDGRVVLTNCPSCLQGLGRLKALRVEPRHVAVELAQRLSGPAWLREVRAAAAHAKPIQF